MKKVWILIAVAAMTLCMTSCGNNNHYTGSTNIENNTYESGDTWNEDACEDGYEEDYEDDWWAPACEDDDEHYWEEGGAPVDEDDDWDDDDYGYGCGYDDNDDWYEDDNDDWYEDDDDYYYEDEYEDDYNYDEYEDDYSYDDDEDYYDDDWSDADETGALFDTFVSACGDYDSAEEFFEECLEAYEYTDLDYLYELSYEELSDEYGISDELYGPDVVYCRVAESCIWVCYEVDENCDYDIYEASVIGIYMEI